MQDTLQLTQEIQNILKANEANIFDLFSAIVGFASVIGLITTVVYQNMTYHESKALAIIERKARKGENLPLMDILMTINYDEEDDGFGGSKRSENSPVYITIKINIKKNSFTNPTWEVLATRSELTIRPIHLEKEAYWTVGDEFELVRAASFQSDDPTDPGVFFYFRLYFDDVLGNKYSKTAALSLPGSYSYSYPTMPRS